VIDVFDLQGDTTTLRLRPRRGLPEWLRTRVEAPEQTDLRHLRLVFLAFAVVNALAVLEGIVRHSPIQAGLRFAAIAGVSFLVVRWIRGYRSGFSWWSLDAAEAVAMVAIGIAAGPQANVIRLFYMGNFFRGLYGSPLRTAVRGFMLFGALIAVDLTSPRLIPVRDLVPSVFALLFTGIVAQLLARTFVKHGRALKRERILRQLAVMLEGVHDDDTMRACVLAALHGLADDDPGTRVSMALGKADEMKLVASAGHTAEEVRDKAYAPDALPLALLEALSWNRIVRPTSDEMVAVSLDFISKDHVVLIPLIVAGDLVGLLIVASDKDLPQDLDEMLTVLASQVSMWIEGEQSFSLIRTKDRERASLLRHLVIAQEDERKSIASDIHDDSIQEMSAVAIRLGILRKHLLNQSALETLTKVETSVDSAIGRLRRLMFSLRPPALDHEGFVPALRQQLISTAEESDFSWELTSDLIEEPPVEVRVQAFRITQEAIANVRKHAEAKNVAIDIAAKDGGIFVQVHDDGVGFVPERLHQAVGHIGVTSMRERAELTGGTYSIDSAPGLGTTVQFWIPNAIGIKEEVA